MQRAFSLVSEARMGLPDAGWQSQTFAQGDLHLKTRAAEARYLPQAGVRGGHLPPLSWN